MTSRFVRVLLVLLALTATLGLSYRAVQDEIAASRTDTHLHDIARTAEAALGRAADLRAALYAYVAEGQGADFWIGQAEPLLENLTSSIGALNEAARAAGVTVEQAPKEPLEVLASAEQRARRYVQTDQRRLAGDLIFNDARNALEAVRQQVSETREAASARARAERAIQQRQRAMLAGAAVLIWLFVAVLLVPVASRPAPAAAATIETDTSSSPSPALAPPTARSLPAPPPAPRPEPMRPPSKPVRVGPDMTAAAALCGDLARAASAQELAALLERAGRVLHATGVILWVADADALHPAASWGYEERVLAHIASIPRDAPNLTAAAFRAGTLRTTAALGGAAAAVAAPLVGPAGPVGVFSAELTGVTDVGENTGAVAAIFAAQLVTLIGSMPAAAAADAPAQQANA